MKLNKSGILMVMLFTLMFIATRLSAQFAGGTGTAADPYLISTPENLSYISTLLTTNNDQIHYKMINDIDLTAYLSTGGAGYNNGLFWAPIGTNYMEFQGTFDGNGKTVRGLKVARTIYSSYWASGLFGYTATTARIFHLNVENANISGAAYCGVLVGKNEGTISFCTVSGSVTGDNPCGGLAGSNGGSISECYSTASSKSLVNTSGGLVGSNTGSISTCYAAGLVSGIAPLGGITGSSTGSVNSSYWDRTATNQLHSAGSSDSFGKLTADMKKQATYVGWNFISTWLITENVTYPYLSATPGTGTAEDPVLIYTLDKFNQLRNYLGTSNSTKYFKLMTDLDLTAYLAVGGAGYNSGACWLPIGTADAPFSGHLDGNGKRITNLRIKRTNTDNVGLFGYVTGEIKNLGVTIANGDSIIGHSYVGGFTGQNKGTISNCYVTSSTTSLIFASWMFPGGFIGQNEGTISNCYATVATRSYSCPGGFVGRNGFQGILTNCYATGKVSTNNNNPNIGGITGSGAGTITNCYWNKETTMQPTSSGSDPSFGKTTAEMKKLATFNGWDFSGTVWKIVEDANYPYLAWQPGYQLNLTTTTPNAGIINGNGIFYAGDAVKISATTVPEYTFEAWEGDISYLPANSATNPEVSFIMPANNITLKARFHKIYPFESGVGSYDNPWMIADAEQLNFVRTYMASGRFFKLKNDINLTTYLSPGNPGYNSGAFWEPIGVVGNLFTANFDGNGKKVTGLKINRPGTDNVGLFGFVYENGHISNLGVEVAIDDTIRGGNYTGIIAGMNQQGYIVNCYALGSVKGYNHVGGLAGKNFLGGFFNSYSAGTVIGNDFVGGISGSHWGNLDKCFTATKVICSATKGGLTASCPHDITTSYWNKELSGLTTSAGSADSFGKTTADMKLQTTYAGWDFVGETANGTEDIWKINNSYPQLAWQTSIDQLAPAVTSVTGNTVFMTTPMQLTATVTDETGVALVEGFYKIGTQSTWTPFNMSRVGTSNNYTGTIPAQIAAITGKVKFRTTDTTIPTTNIAESQEYDINWTDEMAIGWGAMTSNTGQTQNTNPTWKLGMDYDFGNKMELVLKRIEFAYMNYVSGLTTIDIPWSIKKVNQTTATTITETGVLGSLSGTASTSVVFGSGNGTISVNNNTTLTGHVAVTLVLPQSFYTKVDQAGTNGHRYGNAVSTAGTMSIMPDLSGSWCVRMIVGPKSSSVDEFELLPGKTDLAQNYPNPFNPNTEISYQLSAISDVKLAVYNAKGELVKTLVNGAQNAGRHSVTFDGAGLNSGVYFYKLEADGKNIVKRMLMVK